MIIVRYIKVTKMKETKIGEGKGENIGSRRKTVEGEGEGDRRGREQRGQKIGKWDGRRMGVRKIECKEKGDRNWALKERTATQHENKREGGKGGGNEGRKKGDQQNGMREKNDGTGDQR
ncbi:hypothetical protein Tco_1254246 [Tanacetum coccineum]